MNYRDYLNIIRIAINGKTGNRNAPITSDVIRQEALSMIRRLNAEDLSQELIDELVRDLECVYNTWIDQPLTLTDGDHIPWLHQKQTSITWQYWDRYRLFLMESGWAEATVNRLDDVTKDTLGLLEDPGREGNWDVRGLVVGHVQSGKTANYAGLVCRAIDAGYKVIVILAGTLNNLRCQTQIRMDEAVLGFDSIHNLDRVNRESIGVGRIDRCKTPVDTITTRNEDGDFKRNVANQFSINPGGHPLLFIIKKNGSVLRNLVQWVEWASHSHGTAGGRPIIRDVPLLVIDDEADYGSIDTRRQQRDETGSIDEDHDPTIINQRIRQLLFYFEKSAYVGYTATPFANIFIHPKSCLREFGEDLFPRNFITCLPTPSDYMGPSQVFGITSSPESDMVEDDGLPVIREIADSQEWVPPSHRNHHRPVYNNQEAIPPSLQRAIMSFVLACAIRRARGQVAVHNSMLIHVTRFVSVQNAVYNQVSEYLSGLQRRLQYGDGDRTPSLMDEFHALWEEDFYPTSHAICPNDAEEVPWSILKDHIAAAALAIASVRQINGTAGDILDYLEHRNTGLSVIAIGGDKLSRGLTLEGLTVSYFLRTSRMYDTLMQMGRWFGYRPGYKDVCRLYLPVDLREWFRHITMASEELRQEFTRMVAVGGKPSDYGLKVRSHPTLLVTAPVKMRQGAEFNISFAGKISETVVFLKDPDSIRNNSTATTELLRRMSAIRKPVRPSRAYSHGVTQRWNGLLWEDIPANEICRFLREYRTHEAARRVDVRMLAGYIENVNSSPMAGLSSWSVFLASGSGIQNDLLSSINEELSPVRRAWHPDFNPSEKGPQSAYRIRRLLSPIDEAVDIDAGEWDQAQAITYQAWLSNTNPNRPSTPPEIPAGWSLRQVRNRNRGLLIIYPLEPDDQKSELGVGGPPIFGFGISFPGNPDDAGVSYVVNRVYQDQEIGVME
jgi:hypothetical protein